MASSIRAPGWSVELPAGWAAETHPGYVAAQSPRGAEVRFTTFTPENDRPDAAARWAETAAHFDRLKGRLVLEAACGDFRGFEVQFTSGAIGVHGWVLAAGALPLDVTYRCRAVDLGGEVAELRTALGTLRRAAG